MLAVGSLKEGEVGSYLVVRLSCAVKKFWSLVAKQYENPL
jgi:hypothetical protein